MRFVKAFQPLLNILNLFIGCAVFMAINRPFVKVVLKKGRAYLNKKRAAGKQQSSDLPKEEEEQPSGQNDGEKK